MLYLASTSQQRRTILEKAGVVFTVVPQDCDETMIEHAHPQSLAFERARAKAHAADLTGIDDDAPVILGADTLVDLQGEIIGSPRDRAHAVEILKQLAGTTHVIVTAHCIYVPVHGDTPEREAFGVSLARVTMRSMTTDEIQAYVDSGESDGRAGAYAIQEHGDRYVVDLQGEFDTVVGLNIKTVRRLYREVTDSELEVSA